MSRYLPSGFLVTIAFSGLVGLACSLFRCSSQLPMLGHCLLTEIMLWYKLLSPSRSALTAFPGLIRAALRLFAWQTRRLSNGAAHACAKKQKWLQHGRWAVVHQMPHSIMHLFPADVVTAAGSWGSCTSTGLDLHRWNDGRVEGGGCLLVTSSVVERSSWAHDYRCIDIDTIIRYWHWYRGVLYLYSWKRVNATTLTHVLCQSQFCLVCFGTAVARVRVRDRVTAGIAPNHIDAFINLQWKRLHLNKFLKYC